MEGEGKDWAVIEIWDEKVCLHVCSGRQPKVHLTLSELSHSHSKMQTFPDLVLRTEQSTNINDLNDHHTFRAWFNCSRYVTEKSSHIQKGEFHSMLTPFKSSPIHFGGLFQYYCLRMSEVILTKSSSQSLTYTWCTMCSYKQFYFVFLVFNFIILYIYKQVGAVQNCEIFNQIFNL